MTELVYTIARESPRNEAINYLTLVSVLLEKGLATEQEVVQARDKAERLIDRELRSRSKVLREYYETRLAELQAKSKKAEGNLHFAIKSHQKPGRKHGKTSRFHGVDFCKRTGKWRARIKVAGEPTARNLGHFEDEDDAAEAYDIAAQDAYGEHAHLNNVASRMSIKKPR